MNSKFLIPIVGIHSAGKSTIRNNLAKLGYVTEEECAEILRKEKNINAGASADISFEYLVRQFESARDENRIWNSNMILVESWHILTIAYMITRGKSIEELEEYIEYVKKQGEKYNIFCVFLKSDYLKILERSRKLHSENDICQYYEFYKKLGENILKTLDILGFPYKIFNTMKRVEETVKEVNQYLIKIKEEKNEV